MGVLKCRLRKASKSKEPRELLARSMILFRFRPVPSKFDDRCNWISKPGEERRFLSIRNDRATQQES